MSIDRRAHRQGPTRRVDELTRVELDTLRYLSHGLSRDDIARLRVVSPETVKSQVATLRLKLAAKTTAHAVGIALRHRLIE